jgi:hypothetical protein
MPLSSKWRNARHTYLAGLTTKPQPKKLSRLRFIVHVQDIDTHDAPSARQVDRELGELAKHTVDLDRAACC